jgi:hypothetical protein
MMVRSRRLAAEECSVVHEEPGNARNRRRLALAVAGVASLANGAALVLHIVGGLSLPALLAICWSVGLVGAALVVRIAGPAARSLLLRRIGIGLVAGVVATVAYDVAKAILSTLDPSPYNPFEATHVFGQLLIGTDPPDALVRGVGWAFHLANGATFGIAFSLLLGGGSRTRSVLTGIAWGLGLETFQLVLFPGWLSVKFLDEFRTISFGAHIVFGAVLGLLVFSGMARFRPVATEEDTR